MSVVVVTRSCFTNNYFFVQNFANVCVVFEDNEFSLR